MPYIKYHGPRKSHRLKARLLEVLREKKRLSEMLKHPSVDDPNYELPDQSPFTPLNTKTITIRLPKYLFQELDEIRTHEGINISFQIIKATKEYLEKRKATTGNKEENQYG